MDQFWNVIASAAAPLLLLATVALALEVPYAAAVVVKLRLLTVARESVSEVDNLQLHLNEPALVRRFQNLVLESHAEDGSQSTLSSTLDRLLRPRAEHDWLEKLEDFGASLTDEMRQLCRAADADKILRRYRYWNVRLRLRFRVYCTRTLVWPAYKAVIEDSAKYALYFGSVGLTLGAVWWLVLTVGHASPSFIVDVGNGSAIGAFAGLGSSLWIRIWPLYWPSRWDRESSTQLMGRRTAAAFLGFYLVAITLAYYLGFDNTVVAWLTARRDSVVGARISGILISTSYAFLVVSRYRLLSIRGVMRRLTAVRMATTFFVVQYFLVTIIVWTDFASQPPVWWSFVLFGGLWTGLSAYSALSILGTVRLNERRASGQPKIPWPNLPYLHIAFSAALLQVVVGLRLATTAASVPQLLVGSLLFMVGTLLFPAAILRALVNGARRRRILRQVGQAGGGIAAPSALPSAVRVEAGSVDLRKRATNASPRGSGLPKKSTSKGVSRSRRRH